MKQITPHRERLHIARAYIDRHYAAPITLENISSEAGFSSFHLIRLFRAAYRQTPHQYLIQQRIDKAKGLLASGDLPISEICYQVGFESLGSFSTRFRRETGLSPRQYRKHASAPTETNYVPLCFRFKRGMD